MADLTEPQLRARQIRTAAALFVAVAVVASLIAAERWRFQAERERLRLQAVDALRHQTDAVLAAAAAEATACAGAQQLRVFVDAHRAAPGSEPILAPVAAAARERTLACCEWRLEELRHGVGNLNDTGVPAGQTRSGMLAVIGAVQEAAEERMAALLSCGADHVLEQVAAAVLIERAQEENIESAWSAYARLLEADAAGRRDVADLLFPVERRRELAARCVSEGPAAAERASRAREHDHALAMYADLNDCLGTPPDGLTFAAGDRARVARGLAAATRRAAETRRQDEAAGRAARRSDEAARARSDGAARACLNSCSRAVQRMDMPPDDGSAFLQCARRCPPLSQEAQFGY